MNLLSNKWKIEIAKVLDIGTGAGFIFGVMGYKMFGWEIVGSEINDSAIINCNKILE